MRETRTYRNCWTVRQSLEMNLSLGAAAGVFETKSRRGMKITQGVKSALCCCIATLNEGSLHPWNIWMLWSMEGKAHVRWISPALGMLIHPNVLSGQIEKDECRMWMLSNVRLGPRHKSQVIRPSPARHRSSSGTEWKNPRLGL